MSERRQFDFWVGEWDCTWEGGHGSNTVTAELDGMVIVERFDGRPGIDLRGISVSTYDERASMWKQTWADSSGTYLDFTGGYANGQMELRREATVDGVAVGQRMVWREIEPQSFEWLWQRLQAGASEWETLWRIDYARRS